MGHTPGPWIAHGWGDAEVEIVGPNDRVICELAQEYDDHSGAGTNAAIDADASLISAAPELLDACRKVAQCLGDWIEVADRDADTSEDERRLALAWAAIAKAEGTHEQSRSMD